MKVAIRNIKWNRYYGPVIELGCEAIEDAQVESEACIEISDGETATRSIILSVEVMLPGMPAAILLTSGPVTARDKS